MILPSTSGSSKWSISFRFHHQNIVCISPLPIRATSTAYILFLDFVTRTIFGEQYRSLSSSLCSFLHRPVTPQHHFSQHPYEIQFPALTVPSLSHLTSCTPTKYHSYLANSPVSAVSEPALYRLLTFQVQNLSSLSVADAVPEEQFRPKTYVSVS
jgi:hypothetical protein